MTTERAYRSAIPHETACHELRRCAGSQFDPDVVEAFLSVVEDGGEELELDPAQTAAAHVRLLLAAA
jgi:HD-GYP domain-containing protein (c-di-GMP phosphodiesterase class II)